MRNTIALQRIKYEKELNDMNRKLEQYAEFKKAEKEIAARTKKLLSINGGRSVTSFHRELGKLLWDKCGMTRREPGLQAALKRIPELREEFWANVKVTGEGDNLNQDLEAAGRVV